MKTLFPFQREAVKFCASRRGTLVAAGMGCGKTAIASTAALVWLAEHPDWKRVLIICPASLKQNWVTEFLMWQEAFPLQVEATIGIASGNVFPDATVVVINYDILSKPDFEQALYGEPWDVIICDECFPAGTKVLTPGGAVNIEDVREGDEVMNASGSGTVRRTIRSSSRLLVRVETSCGSITCTPNHPFFTNEGWVIACLLNQTHVLKRHDEIMRMVQGGPDSIEGGEILRQELLREMENVTAGNQSCHQEEDTTGEVERHFQKDAHRKSPHRQAMLGAHDEKESNVHAGSQREGLCHPARNWSQARDQERQRHGTNDGGEDCSRHVSRIDGELRRQNGGREGVSKSLQGGCGVAALEDGRGDGRIFSQCIEQAGSRPEEGGEAVQLGVGDSASEEPIRVRSSRRIEATDSRTDLFNIEVSNHPSYFVLIGGTPVLVHNCHAIKSPQTLRTKCVKRLKARRKLGLTGTPILNKPVELFPVLEWLDPQHWTNWKYFVTRYCDAKPGWGKSLDVSGASNLDELNRKLTETVMYRITKEEALKDLPPRLRQLLVLPPPESAKPLIDEEKRIWTLREDTLAQLRAEKQRAIVAKDEAAYKDAASKLKSTFSAAMAAMSKIRHDLGVAKVPLANQHINDALDQGAEKIVVFAHHKAVLSAIADHFQPYGTLIITGETPAMERQGIVDAFQKKPEHRVIVLSILAAGVGLNLQAASHVVMVESDWRPGINDQAESRCHRHGQLNSVLVQHLVFDGSLDAKMVRRCIEKQEVIDQAVDGKAPDAKPHPHGGTAQPKRDMKLIGANMSDAERRTAHAAIRHLAALDKDGARRANGAGFSKVDTVAGHQLAALESPSPAQYATMRQIAMKYKGQLSPSLRIDMQH